MESVVTEKTGQNLPTEKLELIVPTPSQKKHSAIARLVWRLPCCCLWCLFISVRLQSLVPIYLQGRFNRLELIDCYSFSGGENGSTA